VGGTGTVFRIPAIVPAATVVEKRKVFDHLNAGSGFRGKAHSIVANACPVGGAVDSVPFQTKRRSQKGNQFTRNSHDSVPVDRSRWYGV
jgi:hypothetical protein